MATLNITTYPNGYVPTIDEWNNDIFGAIEERVNDITYDQVSTSLAATETSLSGDSTSKFPTQNAVKTYVDSKTGGSGGGSTQESLEILNEIEKAVGSPLGFANKYALNNSFTFDDNLIATLSAAAAAGATAISMAYTSPIQSGQLIPEEHTFYIYDKASGTLEEFSVASAVAGNTYALNSALAGSYASATSYIYRNFGSVNTGSQQFQFPTLSAISGVSACFYNERINADIAFVNKDANIQAKFNTDSWFRITNAVSASKQITVDLGSLSARLAEFATSTASDGNVVWVYNLVFNGNEYFQYGDGKRLTLTGTSYSAPSGILTTSEDFNTTDDITGPSSDQNTQSYLVFEAVKTKYAAGNHGTPESFTDIIPSRIKAYDAGISYPSYIHSHWKLNEVTGNAINSKQPSGTYNLTMVGTVPSEAGKLGNARGVFSTSNYLSWNAGGSATTIYDTKLFIVDGWFKTGITGANQYIFSKGYTGTNGWAVNINSSNQISLHLGSVGTYAYTSATYTDNNWHYFLAGVRATSGANEIRIYIDGGVVVQQNGANFTALTDNFYVGLKSNASEPFQGLLDSLSYWTTVPATWAEVEAIIAQRYAGGRGREYGLNIGHSLVSRQPSISCDKGGYITTQYKLLRNDKTGQGSYNQLLATQTNLI